jgi:dienelactone hydrolase
MGWKRRRRYLLLIAYAGTLPQADTGKVAVVGFSWGGLANAFAAAKDQRIKALVSLDGSLRYYPQLVDGGKDAAKYVTPARVAVPLLYLAAQPKSVEQLAGNTAARYSFMNEMKHSDVYIIALRPMKHANFSSYGLRIEQDDQFGDYTRDEVALAHSWAARYTRHFLDAYLKDDATGLAFVNAMPAANQAPPHMLFTDIRRKKDSAPQISTCVPSSITRLGSGSGSSRRRRARCATWPRTGARATAPCRDPGAEITVWRAMKNEVSIISNGRPCTRAQAPAPRGCPARP